jgi:hypothetical protein
MRDLAIEERRQERNRRKRDAKYETDFDWPEDPEELDE